MNARDRRGSGDGGRFAERKKNSSRLWLPGQEPRPVRIENRGGLTR